MSQVEEDRLFLKGLQMDKKTNSNMSYINTFLKYKDKQPEGTIIKQKIGKLSTINILFAVHEGFKKINKDFYKKLESIKKELRTRNDLVLSLIELIERIDAVYDDLYSWYPGMKYSDPWSFFIELVPNIVSEYKNYYIRTIIAQNQPHTKILEVFKSRMNKSLGDFDVINKDRNLFNLQQCDGDIKRIKKKGEIIRNIISGIYWSESGDSNVVSSSTLSLIGSPQRKIKYNKDIQLELSEELTLVEVEIKNRIFLLSLIELNDLLTKNNRSKEKLINLNLIDENWNLI